MPTTAQLRDLPDLQLMRLHVEAELTHDTNGHLVSNERAHGGSRAAFLPGLHGPRVIRCYRHEVSEARRRALEAALAVAELEPPVAATDAPLDPTPFEHILSEY